MKDNRVLHIKKGDAKMENSLREQIVAILEEIEDAAWEEDYDDIIQRFKDIPDVYWKDATCFSKIIETLLPTANDELTIYPIDVIPDWFWEDKSNVLNDYFSVLWDYYAENRVYFNICELLPMRLLDDPECARLLLECNVDETLSYMSEDLMVVPEIALSALRGVWLKIEWSNDNCSSMRPPFNERECLEEFFEKIPKALASGKEFVLGFISSGYFADDIDLLYDWMDKELWSDRDVVWEALSDNSGALEYVSKDLLQDADFLQKLKEELKIAID